MRSFVACVTLLVAAVSSRANQHYFETKLNHQDSSMDRFRFNMRYLVDDQYFQDTSSGLPRPILFYAGNEGDIWDFYKNSGFMTETLAKEWGALVVFGEHRYFGQSFPFNRKDAFKAGNNTYLTVENTMMDYVELIRHVKAKYQAEDKAVIVFGGSYGGMLAAWIRMKYPATFQGAYAASAPILQF